MSNQEHVEMAERMRARGPKLSQHCAEDFGPHLYCRNLYKTDECQCECHLDAPAPTLAAYRKARREGEEV